MYSGTSFSQLEAFIFDLDGVIWKGGAPIEGAVESVARLRAAGKRVLYCTNNSRHAPAEFAETLRGIGIECESDEVMTSSVATSLYLQSLFTGPYTAYVIGEDGLVQTIRRTGAIVMTSPIVPQRSDLHDNHGEVDCVIVGLDATFTYHKLRVAQRLILGGARFIATNRDATFPTPYGIVPGAGTVIAAIETATGVTPVTLGKPQPFMAHLLMQRFGLQPETTAMIGDRLDTDIVAARRANIAALLVTTGVHSREAGERAKNQQKPDGIFDNLPALCDSILGPSESGTAVAATAVAAAAAIGGATVAADAAQHEPEAVLHTPVAQSDAVSEPLDIAPFETGTEEAAEAAPVETETAGTGPGATEAFDVEPLGTRAFQEAAAFGTNGTAPESETAAPGSAFSAAGAFAFEDVTVDTTTVDSSAADTADAGDEPAGEAAGEAFNFDFDTSLSGDAPEAAATESDAVEETPDETEAADAEGAEKEPAAEERWWESLDSI